MLVIMLPTVCLEDTDNIWLEPLYTFRDFLGAISTPLENIVVKNTHI